MNNLGLARIFLEENGVCGFLEFIDHYLLSRFLVDHILGC